MSAEPCCSADPSPTPVRSSPTISSRSPGRSKFQGYRSAEAVSLTPSEGTVMRYLFPHPGALPSEVASATGLQRSNLSAVLRGLEKRG